MSPREVEAEPASPPAERSPYVLILTGDDAGALIPLRERISIGRSRDVRIRVEDEAVSRRHAVLDVDAGGRTWLEDLGSQNGTLLNGRVVRAAREPLADHDRVQVGAETVLEIAWRDRLGSSFFRSMREGALRDAVTGVYERRYLIDRVRGEQSYAARCGGSVSLLAMGIDNLGVIRRAHGRAAGDRVLAQVARTIERQSRSEDVLARSGDASFAVLVRGVGAAGALALAHRLRARIGQLTVRLGALDLRAIVTLGVCTTTGGELLERAEAALDRARRAGGDRVEAADG